MVYLLKVISCVERENGRVMARELSSAVDQRVLRWFRHMDRMTEYRMARRAGHVNGRSKWRAGARQFTLGWMEGVKVDFGIVER